MKLEDQVCSLELAKKLKELGVKQGESFFVWEPRGFVLRREGELGKAIDYFIDAFTIAELGEMLPHFTHSRGVLGDSFKWMCIFERTPPGKEFLSEKIYEYADTEADARAKMLIHLIENKIIRLNRGLP